MKLICLDGISRSLSVAVKISKHFASTSSCIFASLELFKPQIDRYHGSILQSFLAAQFLNLFSTHFGFRLFIGIVYSKYKEKCVWEGDD